MIALVVAFGVGFLVGSSGRQESPWPANYSPSAALESQGIKAAQESTKQCFDLIAKQLVREASATAAPAATDP